MNRDAKRTADSPIGQRHEFTVTVREFKRQQQAAEKVALLTRPAPARRDAPYPMRRSRIVQILNGDPAASPLGGAHRLGAPYSSHRAPQRVRLRSSLAAALQDELFEQPADYRSLAQSAQGIEMLECYDRFREASWIGYTHHHAISLRAKDIVPGPHDVACPGYTFIYAGPSDQVGPSLLSRSRVDVRPLPGAEREGLRSGTDRLFD